MLFVMLNVITCPPLGALDPPSAALAALGVPAGVALLRARSAAGALLNVGQLAPDALQGGVLGLVWVQCASAVAGALGEGGSSRNGQGNDRCGGTHFDI